MFHPDNKKELPKPANPLIDAGDDNKQLLCA